MNPGLLCRAFVGAALLVAVAACNSKDATSYITSAQSYLAKSNYEAAIIELKNALKEAPNRADARFLLAKALFENGNPIDAELEARKALALKHPADDALPLLLRALLAQGAYQKILAEPVEPSVQRPQARSDIDTTRALAYFALGDRKAARGALEAALAASPDNVNARIAQARLAAAENDLPQALVLVDAILAASPNDLETLLLKADVQTAMGRRDEGIKTLARAVEAKPASAPARLALMGALVTARRLAEAASHLAVAKKIAPTDPRTWHAEALSAFSQGNLAAAHDAIQQARRYGPDHLPSLYLSGIIDFRRGSLAAAEEALRVVVLRLPGDDGARRALAATYAHRGRAPQALEMLEPVLRRAPNDPTLLRVVAEVHLTMGNPDKATEYFAKANALDTGNVPGGIRLAEVRLATGDAARAIRDLEGLALAQPARHEPDLALISAHLQRRQLDKALAAAVALEGKQPANPITHNIKGVVYIARGDYKNARASFEQALVLEPEYAAAEFNLARLDLVHRNYDGARKRYERMLAKDPKSEQVLLALAELLIAAKAPPAEVRTAIGRAITANPNSVHARLLLITYNGQVQDWPAAAAAAQAADTALPDDPRIVEALGVVQYAAGEPNQAIATFKRLAHLWPDHPAPLLRLADVQAKTKDYASSIGSLRAAVALQPEVGGMWIALAAVYADADRLDAGIADARKLQKERTDRAVGFALEGELLARQRKWSEAAIAYRTALVRQPSAFVVSRLHTMLQAAGKSDEAAAVTQRWLKEHPGDFTVRAHLAEHSLAGKDYRAAVPHLSGALEIEPDNVAVLNNLGWALGELGEPKAVEYAARAYALAPDNADMADTYGWVLLRFGDTARAIELLRRAVDLAPADADKRMRLAQALVKGNDKVGARKELETLAKQEAAPQVRAEAQRMLKEL